jgi:aminoglycoside phosphotransferase family enzyme
MMSWLLFAGQFVYKIKKPLHLSFLDARTSARRYELCRQEVALNHRFAPGIYLGVQSIVEHRGQFALQPCFDIDADKAKEFAVLMRRVPANQLLGTMIEQQVATPDHIERLVKLLSDLHSRSSEAMAKVWGSAVAISRTVESNLAEAFTLTADSLASDALSTVGAFARRFLVSHRQMLDNRSRDGWVRDGHGDVRCASVGFMGDDLLILGCVEHSESWRCADLISELAALAVDLDLYNRDDLGKIVLNSCKADYNEESVLLFRFYKCYRATLRAKLNTLASLQADLPLEQRMAARSLARRLFVMARDYAEDLD